MDTSPRARTFTRNPMSKAFGLNGKAQWKLVIQVCEKRMDYLGARRVTGHDLKKNSITRSSCERGFNSFLLAKNLAFVTILLVPPRVEWPTTLSDKWAASCCCSSVMLSSRRTMGATSYLSSIDNSSIAPDVSYSQGFQFSFLSNLLLITMHDLRLIDVLSRCCQHVKVKQGYM